MTDDRRQPFHHEPVMVDEVLDALMPVPEGLVVDGTVGGGGHARALLDARPDLRLLGLDRDPAAVEAAREALAPYGERAMVVQAGFEHLDEEVERHAETTGTTGAVAVLLDLGVSSVQLDEAARGFTYRTAAPLDMRMDTTQDLTAADVVNGYEERSLARVIAEYGEERFARSIARQIVRARPVATTEELVDVIKRAIPAPARRRGGHPAKRTFQAIRIEVNREMSSLDEGLEAGFSVLTPKGRFAVLSYHSLEDRRVKRRFAGWSTPPAVPRGMPTRTTARPVARLVTSSTPTEAELERNPRSSSARLRVLERVLAAPDSEGLPGGDAA